MKNKLEHARLWIETVIALFLFVFTVVYYYQQTEGTKSNLRLAAAQIKSGLIHSISHEDPIRRTMGLHLAQSIDEEFAAEMASILSLHDPVKAVRDQASHGLDILSRSANQNVTRQANLGLSAYQVMVELREKNLLNDLDEARRYYRGRNKTGDLEASRIYKSVYTALSDPSKKTILGRVPGLSNAIDSNVQEELLVRLFHAAFVEFGQN